MKAMQQNVKGIHRCNQYMHFGVHSARSVFCVYLSSSLSLPGKVQTPQSSVRAFYFMPLACLSSHNSLVLLICLVFYQLTACFVFSEQFLVVISSLLLLTFPTTYLFSPSILSLSLLKSQSFKACHQYTIFFTLSRLEMVFAS